MTSALIDCCKTVIGRGREVSTGGSKAKGTRGTQPFISHQKEVTAVHLKADCFKDMNISPKKIVKISGWSIPS